MTQQSHFWAYTPRKPDLKETHAPQWVHILKTIKVKVFTVEQSVITHAKFKTITNLFEVKNITKKHIITSIWVWFNTNLLSNFYIQDLLYWKDGRLFRNVSCSFQIGQALRRAEPCLKRVSQMVLVVNNLPAHARDLRDAGSIPAGQKDPLERAWQPTVVLFPGESLTGYSWWGHQESDTPEAT